MTHDEQRLYLINYLLNEDRRYQDIQIPDDETNQKNLLRALMNVRLPAPIDSSFLDIQDDYLQEENKNDITDCEALNPVASHPQMYLWQGDITTIKADAIVNAANSGMTGCYQPLHNCIDNCIHSKAGIQLRLKCDEIMTQQGYEEPTGQAKLTPAYNLPCQYVIHTVGPIVNGRLTQAHCDLLASCYLSCLKIADEHNAKSIVFCCISTGVFMFPAKRAAMIAVETVKHYLSDTKSDIKVIFNVFSDKDRMIYDSILNQ